MLFVYVGTGPVVVAIVVPILAILILSVAVLVYRCKGCQLHNQLFGCCTGSRVVKPWTSHERLNNVDLSHLDHLQIARNRLTNMQPIGEGNFGKVFLAEAEGIGCNRKERTLVAVKALKDTDCLDARRRFYQEMKIMSELSHPNLLRLIGICTKKQPPFLITEFMNEVRQPSRTI